MTLETFQRAIEIDNEIKRIEKLISDLKGIKHNDEGYAEVVDRSSFGSLEQRATPMCSMSTRSDMTPTRLMLTGSDIQALITHNEGELDKLNSEIGEL